MKTIHLGNDFYFQKMMIIGFDACQDMQNKKKIF